jgi:hypothetical protein
MAPIAEVRFEPCESRCRSLFSCKLTGDVNARTREHETLLFGVRALPGELRSHSERHGYEPRAPPVAAEWPYRPRLYRRDADAPRNRRDADAPLAGYRLSATTRHARGAAWPLTESGPLFRESPSIPLQCPRKDGGHCPARPGKGARGKAETQKRRKGAARGRGAWGGHIAGSPHRNITNSMRARRARRDRRKENRRPQVGRFSPRAPAQRFDAFFPLLLASLLLTCSVASGHGGTPALPRRLRLPPGMTGR